jgi:Rho termination factor, N-terminal domain
VLRRIHGEPAAKPPEEKAGGATPIEEMTVRELRKLASERQIPGRASMSKAELIDALRKD